MKNFAARSLIWLFVGTLGTAGSSTSLAFSGDLPAPSPQTLKEPKKKVFRPRKFLSLAVGVDHDEKLPARVKEPKTKGDFRRIVAVEYSPELQTLRITPRAEGVATLQIYEASDIKQKIVVEYRLEVRKNKLDSAAREIKALLADIEGIVVRIVNNKIVVDGQIIIPKDMNRIYSVLQQYGDQATSLVTLSPLAQKRIAEFMERDIGNPEVRVRALNDKFILEGVVNSEDEKVMAEIKAKAYIQPQYLEPAVKDQVVRQPRAANDGVINLITVRPAAAPPPPKPIQLVVHYVELNKDYNKSFRFQFLPTLQDTSELTFTTGGARDTASSGWAITGIINNFLPKLNWAKSHGYARVLESTSLIVQDGKKGVLNSTREYPYTTAQGGQGVPVTAFKDVGLATAITPTIIADRSDSINLAMEFDISSILTLTTAGPTVSRNKITTELVVRSGQSAAVGGLITNRTNTDFNKLPTDLADNAILSLLASKAFQRNQSQFVVFITPIMKSQASAGSEKIKRKFRLRE